MAPNKKAGPCSNRSKAKPTGQSDSVEQWRQCVDTLTGWFEEVELDAPARQTGFVRRTPKKITPLLFVQAAVLLVSQSAVSLSRWAALLGIVGQTRLAKQSLWERINPQAVGFLQHMLGAVIGRRLEEARPARPQALRAFARVLIQDSTTLKLTEKLAPLFPGSRNQCGAKNGQLKIQAIYELLTQRFVHFGLSGFRRNDQSAAHDVLPLLQAGDLVLRDLGYFVLESFEQITRAGAFFLSRMRCNIKARDPRTGKEFNLLGQLRRYGQLDQELLLGKQKMPVRLVALPLPPAVAAERRRKARLNRDKRCHPSARSLQLLGWAIFITNVPRHVCSAKTVAQIYGLRWHIECLFTVWKSHFRITEIPKGSADQLQAVIYARLLFITLLAQLVRFHWTDPWGDTQPPTSLFKIAALVGAFFLPLCLEAWGVRLTQSLLLQFDCHGRYDQRTRQNFVEKLMQLP